MKAILKFDLDDVDSKICHMRCIKSTDMALVLFDIYYQMLKDVENTLDKEIVDELRDAIAKYLDDKFYEHGIIIDELIR